MYNNQPIGIFDSGVGGTSIWRSIHKLLPNESTIYLADSKNAPYGQKSKEEIIDLCVKNTEYLLNLNCKLIVVACNTATTNAIRELRERYNIPFIGIEPAIKPAVLQSKTQTIGILATQGTLSSELFCNALDNYKDTRIIEQEGHGLVQLIEDGKIYSHEMIVRLHQFIEPMVEQDIDCLVLGCSHYPYLIPIIEKILPKNVKIIDSGEAVAKQTQRVLENIGVANNNSATYTFYTNAEPKVLTEILEHTYNVERVDF